MEVLAFSDWSKVPKKMAIRAGGTTASTCSLFGGTGTL